MENLITTDTFRLDFEEDKNIIIQRWYGDMDVDDYKANMLILVYFMSELPPVRYNIVYPNLTFSISTELQDWTNENVFIPTHKRGLQKVAFIVPQEVFDQISIEFISVEQTMEEGKELFKTRYFTSEEDAIGWFKTNVKGFKMY